MSSAFSCILFRIRKSDIDMQSKELSEKVFELLRFNVFETIFTED